jgi:hypothetical protein
MAYDTPFQHKPDTGSLFKNDKREKDTQPNAKGSALIGGVEYWVSAWTNDGTKGKYQQLKFERKDAGEKRMAEAAPATLANMGDDIPF